MGLYTVEEARLEFVRSSLILLENVDAIDSVLCNLVGGVGGGMSLSPTGRGVAYLHRELISELNANGYGWAVADEIEGIVSCVESETAAGACAILAELLPDLVEELDQRTAA